MLESGIALQEAMQIYKNESYDEEWVECEWCHEPTPEDELVNTDMGKICEYCVQELESRGEPVSIIYNEATDGTFTPDGFMFNESLKKRNLKEAFGLNGFLEEHDKINSADDLIDYFEAYLYNDEFNQEDVADFAIHTITKLLGAISPSEMEKLIAEYNNDISEWLDESIKRKPTRKLTEANADEPMFQAFITNLGKYNEGDLVGEWCAFPIDEDDFEALLKKIGIDGREYEEWFVTDYECQLKGFNWQDLGEYPSYDVLQEVGETLENIDDIEKFDNVYEAIGNFKYAVEAYEDAWFVPEVSDYSDLGVYYIEKVYGYNIPDDIIERYFDFEALGRDLDFDNFADMYDEEELVQMYADGDIQAEDYVSAGEYFGLGSNASNYDIGEAYVNEVGIDGVNDSQNYFDYEKFGRDLAYDGAFTSDGFVFTA